MVWKFIVLVLAAAQIIKVKSGIPKMVDLSIEKEKR
jgi:hypothetical protein